MSETPDGGSTISPDDIGEKRATLEMDHESAIDHVREVFSEAGFGVPTEFSPSELLAEKLGADHGNYYVLGACNPSMADRALHESDNRIGALFPCNVVIWEEEPGVQTVYHVSIMRIARLAGMAPDSDEWEAIIGETGKLVDEAFSNLGA